MSSWLLLAVAQAAAPPTSPVTAEQAMATYRQTFDAVPTTRCAAAEGTEEVVVCGRRAEADRLPLPVEPEPGAPVRLVPGESPRASVPGCVFACHTGFTVTINLDQARKAVSAVKRILGGAD